MRRLAITAIVVLPFVAGACGQIRVVTTGELHEGRGFAIAEPTNLGFEEKRESNLPRSWRVTQLSGPYSASVDDKVKRSGRRSARIRFEGTGKAPYPASGAFNQDLKGSPYTGKTITVTGWIKTAGTDVCEICKKPGHTEETLPEEPRRGAQIRVHHTAASETLVTPLVMGTSDWTRFVAKVEVRSPVDYVIVAPVLWGRGTAWFDDITITPA